MSEVTNRQIDAFKNFLSMLPLGRDTELVLLKGHLLIEEQIRLLIQQRLPNAKILAEANTRLSTHQAIQLARAFFPPGHMPEIWEALLKLNKLRNDIAHNLLPAQSLSDKVNAWAKTIPSTLVHSNDAQENFEFGLLTLFEAISSLVDEATVDAAPLPINRI